jgi:hypothetical protein
MLSGSPLNKQIYFDQDCFSHKHLTGKGRKERRAYLGWDLVHDVQLARKGSEMLLLQSPGALWEAEAPHQRLARGRRWSP